MALPWNFIFRMEIRLQNRTDWRTGRQTDRQTPPKTIPARSMAGAQVKTGQSNVAKAALDSVPLSIWGVRGGGRDFHLMQCMLGFQESPWHSKQNLDSFSRFCTAQSRDRQTEHHAAGSLIAMFRILHVAHSVQTEMRQNITAAVGWIQSKANRWQIYSKETVRGTILVMIEC